MIPLFFPAAEEESKPEGSDTSKVNRSLLTEFDAIQEKESSTAENELEDNAVAIPAAVAESSGAKGKLNRKKRKRRKGHARSGSKSSLKDIAAAANASSSESEGVKQKADGDGDDVFEMENDDQASKDAPQVPQQQPQSQSRPPSQSTPIKANQASACDLSCSEQSFLQSRLGHSTIESILDSQEKLKKEEGVEGRAVPAGSMDYYR